MIDDQHANGSHKQGLTPSPSSTLPSSNTNVDSTNGLKFLMVPGQNAQMSSLTSGKKTQQKQEIVFVVHAVFVFFWL